MSITELGRRSTSRVAAASSGTPINADPEWRDAVNALTELDRAATYLETRPGMCGDRDDAREGY